MSQTGGGKNTNKMGLSFEKECSLEDVLYNLHIQKQDRNYYVEGQWIGCDIGKNNLYKFLSEKNIDWKTIISKKLLPDAGIYLESQKKVYLFEMKSQHQAGSVDEKLQTCDFKRKQFCKLFHPLNIPTHNIHYIYILNDWFRKKEYEDVRNYIKNTGCRYYFNGIPQSLFREEVSNYDRTKSI